MLLIVMQRQAHQIENLRYKSCARLRKSFLRVSPRALRLCVYLYSFTLSIFDKQSDKHKKLHSRG